MEKKIEDLEEEVWKEIIGYEGVYAVSNKARVKSLVSRWRNGVIKREEKLMALNKVGKGYLGLQLKNNSICERFTIHRLVATYFVPNPNNLPEVNHEDGDKSNNLPYNLKWGTSQYNINHAFETGLNKKVQKNDIHRSKPVIQMDIQMNEIAEFPSTMEVQRSLGFWSSNINVAIKNKTISNGYYWKYKS